jgi:hypothetical protein
MFKSLLLITFSIITSEALAYQTPLVQPAAFTAFSAATSTVVLGNDPTSGVLPTSNDAFLNWQNAGLQTVGGIPARTVPGTEVSRFGAGGSAQCGSTVSPTGITPPATGDDADTINAAITACPTGDVVLLNSGTFQLDQSETIIIQKSITLRGSGVCNNASTPYCPTEINVLNGLIPFTGGQCGTSTSAEVACNNGPGTIVLWSPGAGNRFDFAWAGSLGKCGLLASAIGCGTQLDASASMGQTTVQVHTTTGFSVGQWVLIDEATGASFVNDPMGPNLFGQVWAAPDWLSTSPLPVTGRVQWAKFQTCDGSNPFCDTTGFPFQAPGTIQSQFDRPTSEIHVITAIGAGPCPGTNCTITFDDPLMDAYRITGSSSFTGSISGTTLTTSGDNCTVAAGQIVDDATHTIKDGTYITVINSCSGGVGNYTVNNSQTVSSEAMIGGAHQAHLYWSTNASGTTIPFLQNAGVENLTVNRSQAGGVNFVFCALCWVKNAEVVNWGGGIGASGGAVNFNESARVQLDSSYANFCGSSTNNGAEYPLGMENSSTELMIINNIIRQCGKGMVGKAGGGNVIAYNYQDSTMYDAFSSIGDWFVDLGTNGSHWVGTHHYLFEGNWATNLDGDDTHGNQAYHTFFRNWGTAIRTTFTDPSVPTSIANPAIVNDTAGTGWACTSGPSSCTPNVTGPLRAAGPMTHVYWYAYVGNVLGTPNVTTAANGWRYLGNESTNNSIWMSGWTNGGQTTITDPNLNGTNTPLMFKNGNFDYLNNSIVDFATGFSHSLPSSFYASSQPSFFGASGAHCIYPWPWVTPTAASQIQPATGSGCTATALGDGLPAKARFDAGTPFIQP